MAQTFKKLAIYGGGVNDTFINPQIAPDFSTSTAYAIGKYVTYQGQTYRFTAAKTAGAWDATKVTAVNLAGDTDTTLSIAGMAADAKAVGDKASLYRGTINSGDINECTEPGWYSIPYAAIGNVSNLPTGVDNSCLLEVYSTLPSGTMIYQVLRVAGATSGKVYHRVKIRESFNAWSTYTDDTLSKRYMAANAKAVGDKAHIYKGQITSGTLSDKKEDGWWIISYNASNPITDLPDGVNNLAFLHTFSNGVHFYQVLFCHPSKFWFRDITSSAVGSWNALIDSSLTLAGRAADAKAVGDNFLSTYAGNIRLLTSEDDADTITRPGSYPKASGATPANLPSDDYGLLIVFSDSTSNIFQGYVTLDGRFYLRRVGRAWRAFSNPYISPTNRVSAFVSAMNAKAKKIGMSNSSFATPSGQGTSNTVTANDMLKLCVYANTYQDLKRISGVISTTISISGTDVVLDQNEGFNTLLPEFVPVWGKTGSWNSSESPVGTGYRTLICVAYHPASGRTIAGAILLADNDSARFTAMKELFTATITKLDGGTPSSITHARCAASCQVFDGSARVTPVIQQNADEVTVPASTTKTLCLITALDCKKSGATVATVASSSVQSGGNLSTGDTITLDDLYSDMMVISTNTAAYEIARVCGEQLYLWQNGITPATP